jgi:hypothetical protein
MIERRSSGCQRQVLVDRHPLERIESAARKSQTNQRPKEIRGMMSRLTHYWVYGGFLAGILILVLLPEFARHWSLGLLAVFLQLPAYMLHQYEEHDNDRFRLFVNKSAGREVLTTLAVFIINVPGVWGINAASFLLAACVSLGYGLSAIYLTLVNALVHIGHSVLFRAYNPGVATAVLLFLPASVFGLVTLQPTGQIEWYHHLLGILIAIGIHVAIIVYVKTRITKADRGFPKPVG